MPIYPALYTEIQDGDDGTAASVNSRLTEISNAIGEIGDGTDPLASPQIQDYTNSQHDHSDAADGGLVPFDNLDTSGANAGDKWVADGAGGGSWVSGYPILSAMSLFARISDDGNRWLRCDGRTIGNATSGGTARANADMEDLFTHLWSEFANTELVIEDSTGTPTTRGASAAADWAADKRMPLLDTRGRTIAGMDDPTGGDAANIITDAQADVLGGVMGAETHTLVETELPADIGDPLASNAALVPGNVAYQLSNTTNLTASIRNTGGDQPHANVQPTMFLNYFIYTGN